MNEYDSLSQEKLAETSGVAVSDSALPALSLIDVITGLWRYRWWTLVAVTVSALMGGVIAFSSQQIYRAEVLVSPRTDDDQSSGSLGGIVSKLGGLTALAGIGKADGVTLKDEALAILKSRAFILDFVKSEKLLPALYPDVRDQSDRGAKSERPTDADVFRLFSNSVLSGEEDDKTGLITIAVEWSDPNLAAEWANKLVARINDDTRRRAIDESQRSIAYLNQELTKTNLLGLQESISQLIESHISQVTLANTRDGYAFRVIDPAVPPESSDFVKPRRVLIIALSLFMGGVIAFFFVLTRLAMLRYRAQ